MNPQDVIAAITAGTIQGVTELLPVSSSGHLLLFSSLSEIELSILSIAVLHLGTLGALIIVMRDKLAIALRPPVIFTLIIGIVPAGIIGLLFLNFIDRYLGNSWIIAASLAIWGVVMIFSDKRAERTDARIKSLEQITPKEALIIGLAQILAFIPGTSRSGITTIAGITQGMSRTTSLNYSFLIGIPLLAVSGLYALGKLIAEESIHSVDYYSIFFATIFAFLIGLVAASVFRKFIEKRILTICGVYRIVLSLVLAAVLIF